MALKCLLSVSLFLWTFTNAQVTYNCTAGQICEVDCENNPDVTCNSGDGSQVIINAEDATSLRLICYQNNSCQNILVECPITPLTTAYCDIECSLDLACKNMMIHTHNTTNINLKCSDNTQDRAYPKNTTCLNVTIDGEYLAKEDKAPDHQNINIRCGDEGEAPIDTPSCDLISFVLHYIHYKSYNIITCDFAILFIQL